MNVRVWRSLLPLKMHAGEMLIIPGHEARRMHSSKAGLDAAEPESAGLNLIRSESHQLLKTGASVETTSQPAFITCVTRNPAECVEMRVFVCICGGPL